MTELTFFYAAIALCLFVLISIIVHAWSTRTARRMADPRYQLPTFWEPQLSVLDGDRDSRGIYTGKRWQLQAIDIRTRRVVGYGTFCTTTEEALKSASTIHFTRDVTNPIRYRWYHRYTHRRELFLGS